ncbi:hypothetical protein AQUCO_05400055v1 [Aquilegia coerulea]|uniref:Uncharacterized protein n=1 Tax=Aquilegia coerulea TaxID=218851 RepID=A0A2G5CHC4_AQUCA|nr:hypothetical protein AQUCO_05400055v1 [Aquilegia coerulea]
MIQDRLADDQSDSQWRTDISLVSGLTAAPQHESDIPDPSRDKSGMSGSYEPDDLYMMLDRNSGADPAAGWAAEVDYSMDLSLTEVAKQNSGIDVNDCIADKQVDGTISDSKSNGNSAKKQAGNDTRSKPLRGSLGKSKTEIISRNKKPSTISRVPMHKTKFETEEETRKRMEELVIERQKRIAERSAARGLTPAAAKKAPVEIKKATIVKDDKRTKNLSLNKPGITNSTVNRLTSSTGPLKSTKSMKTSTKENGEIVTNLSSKNTKDENKKSKLNLAKSSRQLNGSHSPLSDVKDKDQSNGSESKPKIQLRVPQEVQPLVDTHISADKEFHGQSSTVSQVAQTSSVKIDTVGDKSCNVDTVGIKLPLDEHSARLDSTPLENGRVYIASPVLQDYKKVGYGLQDSGVAIESSLDVPQAELRRVLDSSAVDNGSADDRILTSTEISEEATPDWGESTPPSATEFSLDQSHSRKKWTSDEPSPSSAKGFKKLLLFGRKKVQVAA